MNEYHWSESMNACAKLFEGIDLRADRTLSLLLSDFQKADREATAALYEAARMDRAQMVDGALYPPEAISVKVAEANRLSGLSRQRFDALLAAIEARIEPS